MRAVRVLLFGLCLVFLAISGDALSDAEAKRARAQVETVHVIFMTHLDLGFTDLERNVEELYFNSWFPNAIEVADALRQRGGEEQFIWTTHSWLLTEYLRNGTAEQVTAVEAAIARGDIQWQAGPFNLQTENMDSSLYAYSLSLSAQLDARFGKDKKTGASQKDVPGATRGILPIMHEAGITFFHVGANDASTPPAVPDVSPFGTVCNTFVWRDNVTDTEVVCAWCNGYSHVPWGITPEMEVIVPGFSDALVFLMMVDNRGPQNESMVIQGWANVRALYPNATIIASSLEAFAARIETAKALLPVYTGEIGDTWIYGIASDPQKIRIFRELSRQRAAALAENASLLQDEAFMEFSRVLTKVPEHTWGLANTVEGNNAWSNAQFQAMNSSPAVLLNEQSWNEQRNFNLRALAALSPLPSLQAVFTAAVAATSPYVPDLSGYTPVTLKEGQLFKIPSFVLGFDANTAAITYLLDQSNGRTWASAVQPLAAFHYSTFSAAHMLRFQAEYNMCPPYCDVPDFGKPGLPTKHTQHWDPTLVAAWLSSSNAVTSFVFHLTMPSTASILYGAPSVVYMNVTVPHLPLSTLYIELQWFNKTATRLAEATWLSFVPLISDARGWILDKLGMLISPYEVCVNGSRALHGVWKGIYYTEKGSTRLTIESLDAPLVAPGNATLLKFDNALPQCEHGMHFNLHNNLWNTNYPVWYSDNERFRFSLTFN